MLIRLKPSFIPAFGWLIIVTVLLCLPGKEFPSITWLNKIWFDKWVHIGLLLVLVLTFNWGFTASNYKVEKLLRSFILVSILSFMYGGLLEVVQHYIIPYRSFDIWDLFADAAGCILGYLLSVRWFKKIDPSRNWGRNQN